MKTRRVELIVCYDARVEKQAYSRIINNTDIRLDRIWGFTIDYMGIKRIVLQYSDTDTFKQSLIGLELDNYIIEPFLYNLLTKKQMKELEELILIRSRPVQKKKSILEKLWSFLKWKT